MQITVDGLGNPWRFILTGGQENDITQAAVLLAGYAGEYVIADKGYGRAMAAGIHCGVGDDGGDTGAFQPDGGGV